LLGAIGSQKDKKTHFSFNENAIKSSYLEDVYLSPLIFQLSSMIELHQANNANSCGINVL
jgi:hypothetical protein